MRPNPQFPADLVAFTEEIFNGKLHFLCSVKVKNWLIKKNPKRFKKIKELRDRKLKDKKMKIRKKKEELFLHQF